MGCTRAFVLLFRDTNATQDPINESSGSPSSRKDRQSGHDNAKPANGDALSAKESQTNDTTLPDAPPQEPTVEAPEPPAVPEVPGDIEMQEAGNGEPDDQNTRAEATQQPSATQPEGQDGTQKEKPVEKPQEPQPSDVQPQETQHSVESTKPAPKKQRKSRSPPQTEDPPSTRTEKDPAAAKEIEAPAQLSKEKKKTQRARERSLNGDSSPGQAAEKPRKEDGTRSKPRDSQASGARGKRSGSRPLSSGKNTDEAQARLEPEPEQPQPEPEADEALNPRRGRPAKKDKKSAEPESNTTAERPEADVDAQLEKETGPSKPSRGRPARKDKTPAEPESTTRPEESEAVDVQLEKDAGRSKSRGRSAKKDKQSAASESNTRTDQQEEEPAPSKASRGRPARKDKTSDNAEESEPQPDPQPEPAAESSKSHRAKDGKKKKRTREPEPEAAPPEEQPVPESAQQPGPEQPDEEEQEPEDSRPSQQGTTKRGRKSKKTAAETTPTEEPAESEPARERRKPREPRGETVPVTVHRLANSSALGMMYASGGSDEENEDSADELSTRQKTKLPKRGGVNPADVLGQICRETLEKTLTALKNGIENESNTQRRAEWTRKRKAVEAFGSELDGRLLDLSEMLDSNFVLGVQLKKEKRDMIDLRTHLYKVRKEREAIALQMDAVRAKHMEEEAAKTVGPQFYEV